jgi:hypothetical protein
MKKQKLIIRIVAIVLVAVLALGFIVPYVSATEVGETATQPFAPNESNDLNAEPSEGSNDDAIVSNPKPTTKLPNGFEYVLVDEIWKIKKTDDNQKSALHINYKSQLFDTQSVIVFIGNIETHEVKYYELYNEFNYLASIDLPDGYYVVYANGLAWSDKDGRAHMLSGGEYEYLYIGEEDNYQDLYGVNFRRGEEIFGLSMEIVEETSYNQLVAYNSKVLVTSDDLAYPEDAKLEKIDHQVPPPTEQGPEPSEPTQEEKTSLVSSLRKTFGIILKRSIGLIFVAALCGIGLIVIRIKKKIAKDRQAELDKYDDRRID